MFDMIQRNNALTQEWATLLIQLVSSGVVDIQNNGCVTLNNRYSSLIFDIPSKYCLIQEHYV